MKNLILCLAFSTFSIFSSALTADQKEIPTEDCKSTLQEINVHKDTLNKMLASLDSLLGSEKQYEVPLKVLFQVDLENSK